MRIRPATNRQGAHVGDGKPGDLAAHRDVAGCRATADLAHAIATDGIARHEVSVAAFTRWARSVGAAALTSPTVLAVLVDRSQPTVARERAFGRVTQDLAQRTPARGIRRSA
ncbi:MAG: hypothetical protein ACKV2O_00040 [Acidimicrobiales bacterium]